MWPRKAAAAAATATMHQCYRSRCLQEAVPGQSMLSLIVNENQMEACERLSLRQSATVFLDQLAPYLADFLPLGYGKAHQMQFFITSKIVR